jgi:SSS family solute:Na+ symporter
MAILFLLNAVIMLLIGALKPRETDYVQAYTEQVDIQPYKHVQAVGIAICLVVIAIYVAFAK